MKIISHKTIKQIPSASGMEMLNNSIYVCGDDSDFLFQISEEGEVLNKFPLIENTREGRVAKLHKYDFEAMVSHQNEIWLFGSGSLENRKMLLIFNTDTKQSSLHSLQEFYAAIQYELQIKNEDFNIEGAAIYKEGLFLMNRADNSIISCSLEEFKGCVFHQKEIEDFDCVKYHLPSIDGFVAGFSGASVYDDLLFFSASVEKTSDWVNDGEILGSFIGIINLCAPDEEIKFFSLEGEFKIEALMVLEKKKENYVLLAMTDNDNGESELLKIEL